MSNDDFMKFVLATEAELALAFAKLELIELETYRQFVGPNSYPEGSFYYSAYQTVLDGYDSIIATQKDLVAALEKEQSNGNN